MKNGIFVSFCLVVSCLLLVVSQTGCGQTTASSATTTSTTSTTTTTVAAIQSVTISGSLYTGTVNTQAIRAASSIKILANAQAVEPDYTVVAVSKNTGTVYYPDAATDSSGNFTISNLPTTESFYLDILDSANKLAAPVSLGTEGTNAVMALTPESHATVELGQITYDSSKGAACPTVEPSSFLDVTATVEPKSGETLVPKGSANFGKGSVTSMTGYDASKVDGDKDGLPNFFDADNNGDLIVDEFDGMYSKEALVLSAANFYSYIFTNLKVDYDNRNTYKQTYSTFSVAFGVTENTKGNPGAKSISSVKLLTGPTWISKAKIAGTSNYWSASNYDVPLKSTGVYEVQLNNLAPTSDVNAGDTFKFRVTFTDSTTEDAVKMLNFVFTDIPSLCAYRIGSNGAWQTNLPVNGRISIATTSEVGMRWFRPKDENGNEITGGRYTWEYNTNAGGASEYEVIALDSGAAPSLEATYNAATFPDFKAADAQNEFMLGICIRSLANDNSAVNTRYQKGW